MFSPRARGCSVVKNPYGKDHKVFPACAGMFPAAHGVVLPATCFPRVRGDVPVVGGDDDWHWEFSPRARGCSYAFACHNVGFTVFPACAGMFLREAPRSTFEDSFPRVRGDVPSLLTCLRLFPRFSPRARGCSIPIASCAVYRGGFPRVRGDVPHLMNALFAHLGFSPRARGCSGCQVER